MRLPFRQVVFPKKLGASVGQGRIYVPTARGCPLAPLILCRRTMATDTLIPNPARDDVRRPPLYARTTNSS